MNIAKKTGRQSGALTTDLLIAIALLAFAVFPLMSGYVNEQKQARVYSFRATTIEAVDGELELICATGRYPSKDLRTSYVPLSAGVTNLPAGAFTLDRQNKTIRLTFTPTRHDQGGSVTKEFQLP